MAAALPSALKSIQPFLVISKQFAKRDVVVAYFANMYAVQEGIKLGKGDPDAKAYLMSLMDNIQTMKRTSPDEDAWNSDDIAQSHIEEVAFRLFDHADQQDRAAKFDRNMIKAFFTASQLFTILKQFGELSEEIEGKMKYAKWKAVEVDRCLKNGITPTPGPPGGSDEDEGFGNEQGAFGGIGFNVQPPQPNTSYPPPPSSISYPPPVANPYPPNDTPRDVEKPVPKPRHNIEPESQSYPTPSATSGPNLGPAEIAKAQKLCKFAGSALEYEDIPGAIEFLEQAITLLKTGSGQ